MNGYLLDTHVWYWLLSAAERDLRPVDRKLIEDAARDRSLYLSAISIWETAQKQASGKLQVSVEALMEQSLSDGRMQLSELSTTILIAANRLPGSMDGDPVDRMLVATARELDLTLVTHDTGLLRYAKQGYLRVHKV